jgi:hypothetical protein
MTALCSVAQLEAAKTARGQGRCGAAYPPLQTESLPEIETRSRDLGAA